MLTSNFYYFMQAWCHNSFNTGYSSFLKTDRNWGGFTYFSKIRNIKNHNLVAADMTATYDRNQGSSEGTSGGLSDANDIMSRTVYFPRQWLFRGTIAPFETTSGGMKNKTGTIMMFSDNVTEEESNPSTVTFNPMSGIKGLSLTKSTPENASDGAGFEIFTAVIENIKDTDITIKQAGLIFQIIPGYRVSSTVDTSDGSCLVAREIFKTPIVLKPGEVATITIVLK